MAVGGRCVFVIASSREKAIQRAELALAQAGSEIPFPPLRRELDAVVVAEITEVRTGWAVCELRGGDDGR
jgi:hypothetical protein